MEELIKSAKDFRIIPSNVENSSICTVIGVEAEKLNLKLELSEKEITSGYRGRNAGGCGPKARRYG